MVLFFVIEAAFSVQWTTDNRFGIGQDSSNKFASAVWCVGSLVLTRE